MYFPIGDFLALGKSSLSNWSNIVAVSSSEEALSSESFDSADFLDGIEVRFYLADILNYKFKSRIESLSRTEL